MGNVTPLPLESDTFISPVRGLLEYSTGDQESTPYYKPNQKDQLKNLFNDLPPEQKALIVIGGFFLLWALTQ
jgi:hypothetical protein